MKLRFAPSPTGGLHIGNARTAIVNYLFAKHHHGSFILRIDDTDVERSTEQYVQAIIRDLQWLGLEWDEFFRQSERIVRYTEVRDHLIHIGRIYECYETQAELEIKRNMQLKNKMPPIYDRYGLSLTEAQKSQYRADGRRPHYRFLMTHEEIKWHDMIRGDVCYDGADISDPIVIREDGGITYMLSSVVDDIDKHITHIIRGEDHITNTAIQEQMFKAIGHDTPTFGHLSLIKSKDDKISKRVGGFEVSTLSELEPNVIVSFLATIGTSSNTTVYSDIDEIALHFDIKSFSKSPTTYTPEELRRLNHKFISGSSFHKIQPRLQVLGIDDIDENFWNSVRHNLNKISDVKIWQQILHSDIALCVGLDTDFLKIALELLPQSIDVDTWRNWTNEISRATGKTGQYLYRTLRLALTDLDQGPEMSVLLPLLGRDKILSRISAYFDAK